MSKFYTLVRNIEKLKKEIEETKSVEDFIKVYNSFKYLF